MLVYNIFCSMFTRFVCKCIVTGASLSELIKHLILTNKVKIYSKVIF